MRSCAWKTLCQRQLTSQMWHRLSATGHGMSWPASGVKHWSIPHPMSGGGL
jgi:hypothetical protein